MNNRVKQMFSERQTTRQKTAASDLIDRLQAALDDEKARVKYLRNRIEFLESRLKQKEEKTISHYKRIQPYLKSMRNKVFAIFQELPYDVGLTYEEVITEFEKRYPDIPTKNLPRRIRELCKEEKIWSRQDPDSSKVRFYLRLKE